MTRTSSNRRDVRTSGPGRGRLQGVPVLLVPAADGGTVQHLAGNGTPTGDRTPLDTALTAARPETRWVWADTAQCYPQLLAAGGRVGRCHDLALTEALLLGYDGRWGRPRSVAAAWSRLHDLPVPDDVDPGEATAEPTLFEPVRSALPAGVDPVSAVAAVYADQLRRIAATEDPGRFSLLVAAESAGALAAFEMTATGLPWSAEVHAAKLTELLGARTSAGVRPARLVELSALIDAAFEGRRTNPDSPADVLAAFTAAGRRIESTRSWVLRKVDHPAVEPLLAYKKLARIHAANGWAWQERWVREGRFRPEYVPGGVVSGRWATRGGGGLQIPKVLRGAVRATLGHILVVADAGQLEPRLLAALSEDPGMATAAQAEDMYAAIAARSFGGDRARAKVGLLGAMYGQVGGQAAAPLAVLRQEYPAALRLLEEAARTGEDGGLVRSHLGRTCPPVGDDWVRTGPAARARGRFTRNFVVQATAAEWALTWLAVVRSQLTTLDAAELVFFAHDELVVHAPAEASEQVVRILYDGALEAGRLLFGSTPVRFPLDVSTVGCYADAG
ncbi:MAG: bifunctional 3'-5' exonuclease/DNA polymerase [Geodermatophilaceae bacterium]|nr:bifunctional 3'-5' exonuclease/DNA polymerase [Geodermatophilaceae bacterium]